MGSRPLGACSWGGGAGPRHPTPRPAQDPYLLPDIFELLHALGHLLEAAVNLTWPGRKGAAVGVPPEMRRGARGPGQPYLGVCACRPSSCPTDSLSSYSRGLRLWTQGGGGREGGVTGAQGAPRGPVGPLASRCVDWAWVPTSRTVQRGAAHTHN